MHYTIWRPFPENFHIVTNRARPSPSHSDGSSIAGKTSASIITRNEFTKSQKAGIGTPGKGDLSLFVQGPLADSTEEALKGLLAKMETMLGARWERYDFDRKDCLDK
ncbi:hypothetical protein LTR09_004177 [Extremus antarcticus]|uniref:Uncharacterized protein n=1 Tax=Extremus antarcticus TaxID=702011 RepID=A0AAJ0DJF1_9PEZI|nr:hypothetical protein LTR09_004177 [Extremus antarcticus]